MVGDGAPAGGLGVERVVVEQHEHAVGGAMHVALDVVDPGVNGGLEGGEVVTGG
ncbi:MAG: hypothetical protein AAFN30_02575 [Actinomycetota bacterium]